MNDIIPFDFETHPIRVVMTEAAEPWFVAADVCTVLGMKNPRQAVANLEDDEKGVSSMDTPGGNQSLTTVNESGLYALIFKSRKEQAKRFRKWVTAEVLPSLRKSGFYSLVQPEGEQPTDMAVHSRSQRIIEHRRVFMEFKRLVNAASSMPPAQLELVNQVTAEITGIDTIEVLQSAGWEPPCQKALTDDRGADIEAWLAAPEQEAVTIFTTDEILIGAFGRNPEDISHSDRVQVGLVMRRLGWRKSRQVIGKAKYRWIYHRPPTRH